MATIATESLQAVFSVPQNDGQFVGPMLDHFRMLARRKKAVVLAFPPKAAGTFFRTAIIDAVGGQLVRGVHAQGGRDATPYLPTFVSFYSGVVPADVMVAHLHMQALPANRYFLEAFDIKPIIMLRSIPDMLASYWDMLESDPLARKDGLNCQIPADFLEMPAEAKADFLVDVLGPWYASYFATWQTYVSEAPGRVCVLTYDDFKDDPAMTMVKALDHVGLPRTPYECQMSLEAAWGQRERLRFNKGESGRSGRYFTTLHRNRLARMLGHYKQLAPLMDVLLSSKADAVLLRAS